jgi:hypothetical protein
MTVQGPQTISLKRTSQMTRSVIDRACRTGQSEETERMPLLILALIAAVVATLFVHAKAGQSLLGFLAWWLMIIFGLTFLGWAFGLVSGAP